jgi:thymidylate synthase
MFIKAKDTVDALRLITKALKEEGQKVNARGLETLELSPVNLKIESQENNILIDSVWAHNFEYVKREFSWYMQGRKDTEYIAELAPFWRTIAIGENKDEANSAYGRWIFNEGVNQFRRVFDILEEDNSSRKALIYLGDRNNFNETDTICTNSLQFLIRDDKLHLHVNMRSNDIFWGFRNDTVMFMMIQQILADLLDIPVGSYYLYTPSMHIYKKDFEKLDKLQDVEVNTKTVTRKDLFESLDYNELITIYKNIMGKKFGE